MGCPHAKNISNAKFLSCLLWHTLWVSKIKQKMSFSKTIVETISLKYFSIYVN